MSLRFGLICILLGTSSTCFADFDGKVISILDGDTIDVLVDQKPIRVRLINIDAPEKKQAWGTQSKNALGQLIFNQYVHVISSTTDRYGRVLGTVWVNQVNVNKQMVGSGLAWVYRQYLNDQSYLPLEENAKRTKSGLWSQTAIPPWEFRHAD